MEPVTVFVSYAHEDESYRSALETHLTMLGRQGYTLTWSDRRIAPGSDWHAEIDARLDAAHLILLLVSPDFLASNYIWEVEVKRALQRQDAGDARVVPIILRTCDWTVAPFARLQALPRDAKPISQWLDADEVWNQVTTSLREVIEERRSRRPVITPKKRWLLLVLALGACAFVAWRWGKLRVSPPVAPPGMVLVAGGTFELGSTGKERSAAIELCVAAGHEDCAQVRFRINREAPAHEQRVDSFFMDRDEVTAELFAAWLNSSPRDVVTEVSLTKVGTDVFVREPQRTVLVARIHPSLGTLAYDAASGRFGWVESASSDTPANYVTWHGALRYCIDAGGTLPSEAHWEYAARGKERRRYPWGDTEPTCEHAVYGRTSVPGEVAATCQPATGGPVAASLAVRDATPRGIRNLAGNVSEWVYDEFEPYKPCQQACPTLTRNALGGSSETERVFRGGNFVLGAIDLRATARSKAKQATAAADIGFRCMRAIEHEASNAKE